VLIDEAAAVVDLVVDDHVQVLLGVVAGDLLEGEFLVGRHDGGRSEKQSRRRLASWTGNSMHMIVRGGERRWERESCPSEAAKMPIGETWRVERGNG
jgi:hypothetical protein